MAQKEKTLSRKTIIGALVALAVALASVVAFMFFKDNDNQKTQNKPFQPIAVPVTIDGADDEISIGLIYSRTNDPNQGDGWYSSLSGAQVASYRLTQGGLKTTIIAVNDYGTKDGAREAVATLTNEKVSGIIVGTSGSHCSVLSEAAATSNIPFVFLYENVSGNNSYSFALSPEESLNLLKENMNAEGLSHSLVLTDDARHVIQGADSLVWDSFHTTMPTDKTTQDTITKRVSDHLAGETYDSFVISGNPVFQAYAVTSLQQAGLSFPIFLTPQARNPLFVQTLHNTGTLYGDMRTIGFSDADTLSTRSDIQGSSAAAFLSALRALNRDTSAMSVDNAQPLGAVSAWADALSHDAILSFGYACGKAQDSCEAEKISEALANLSLSQSDGTISSLDFSTPQPFESDSLVLLNATNQDIGMRETQTPRLYWYSEDK